MLRLQNVSKELHGVSLLRDVSVTVEPGQIVALVGPNGAGKTTTLRILMGFLAPTSGLVETGGEDMSPHQFMNAVGYVSDDPFFYDDLSGMEFVEFTNNLRGIRPFSDSLDALKPLIEQLELGPQMGKRIGTYSLGTKRKLAILLSLMHGPKYLVLDEPFNGLDPSSTYHMKEFLRTFARDGGGVLVSTHQLDLVQALCTDVTIIHEGATVLSDRISSFLQRGASSLERTIVDLIFQGKGGTDACE